MAEEKKIELTKEVVEKSNEAIVRKETPKPTREGETWRNVSDEDLEKRIVYAYLDALDFADDDFIEEATETITPNKDSPSAGSELSPEKDVSNPSKLGKTENKTKRRDNLLHYEKLYRCYNDRRQNELKTTIVRCTTIVLITTLIFCFLTLLIPSKGYVVSTDSAVTATIDGSFHTLETSVKTEKKHN